jgi:hypothetical protein
MLFRHELAVTLTETMWQCLFAMQASPRSHAQMLFQHQICNRLNDDRTISNNLIFACARLVAVLLYYSTLLTS